MGDKRGGLKDGNKNNLLIFCGGLRMSEQGNLIIPGLNYNA